MKNGSEYRYKLQTSTKVETELSLPNFLLEIVPVKCLVQNKGDVLSKRNLCNGLDIIGALQRFARSSLFLLSELQHVVKGEKKN
jgi:hypothetical protein